MANENHADFTPSKKPYVPVGSFKFWAQKVLPTIYDDSLSYYEVLTKLVYHINKMIDDMDNFNETVDSTLEAYNKLQEYVNHYFDSLDVQKEINGKLDAMAASGELSNLLAPFIPNLVTNWLNTHVNPVGSAVVVDNTLSITGAAADAKVTGDIRRDLGDVSEEVGARYNINFTVVSGEYIGSDLTTTSSDVFCHSNPIQVSKGDIVRFTACGYLTYVSMITLCDANGNNRRYGQPSLDSTVRLYELSIEVDGYIIVSYHKNYEHTLTILSDTRNSVLVQRLSAVDEEVGARHDINFTVVSGEYIGSDLATTSSETFCRSNPIQVSKGDIVRFNARGYLTYVSMITLCDANGNNRRYGQPSIDSTVRLYELSIEVDGYIIVSFHKNYEHTLTILSDTRNSVLDKRLSVVEDAIVESNLSYNVKLSTNDGFIDSTGSIASHQSFIYSDPFQVYAGQIVEYTTKGYLTDVSLLSEFVNGTYHVIKASTDSDIHTYKYTAERDCLLVLSSNKSVDYGVKVTYDLSVALNKNSPTNYMTMFHKIGVIGDSLASGEIVRNNDYTNDRYAFSWLANIGRRNGVTIEHYSKGGITAKAWTENNSGLLDKFNNDSAPSLVYIALGTNDVAESYPVGTSADSSTTNSFCGYMKKIIEIVKAKNPNALICLVSLYTSRSTAVPYSNAIKDIANANSGCYYVDYINNCGKFDIYTGGWDIVRYGHFTTTAYVDISEIIERLTNEIVNVNHNALGYFGLDND